MWSGSCDCRRWGQFSIRLPGAKGRGSRQYSGNSSEPDTTAGVSALAHTTLLSTELCHVGLPTGSGFGAYWLGLVSGLRKWVTIWRSCPEKRVAWGRLPLTVQEAPVLVGRQT